ncbi:hypothetical protein J6590_048662 [Homalodisca vitripennis]|nr:hypothetical protein J6590_048662 [Homalodisca vitripennis]
MWSRYGIGGPEETACDRRAAECSDVQTEGFCARTKPRFRCHLCWRCPAAQSPGLARHPAVQSGHLLTSHSTLCQLTVD